MSSIQIQDRRLAGATMLPDDFVDYFMPRANGEFVKIFLYLLRSAHAPDRHPSLSTLADVFSCTEKDVLRALRYWEKAGLLELSFSGGKNAADRELEEVTLLPISRNLAATRREPDELFPELSRDASPEKDASLEKDASVKNQDNPELPPAPATKQQTPAGPVPEAAPRPAASGAAQISSTRMRELKDNEEAKKILFVAEQYLGHPLSTTDIRRLLYFYDELHFPFDLLDYLIEYSVTKGGHNLNYIEKVGLAWHAEGIRTLRDARASAGSHNKEYYAIFKAFGIRNRDPIPDEKTAMNRWLSDYGFSQELIAEAAARTIRKTGQPSFPYAEKILSDWHRSGVRTLEDVAREDQQHREKEITGAKKAPAASGARTGSGSGRTPANRFSDFSQRNDYDFDRLEQAKLRKQARGPAADAS